MEPLSDMVLLLGASGPNSNLMFKHQKFLAKKIISNLDTSANHIGIITYGKDTKVAVKLGQHRNDGDLKSAIDNLQMSQPSVDGLASGLDLARGDKMLDGGEAEHQVVVAMTNKRKLPSQAKENIQKIRDTDTKLIFIGIGDEVQRDDLEAAVGADNVRVARDESSDNDEFLKDLSSRLRRGKYLSRNI